MDNRIFRKVALDRLASPEQLDQTLRVTDARGWIALSAVGLLLAAALVWSVTGTLPHKVAGAGMLVKSGGVLEVVAPAEGRVSDVAVEVGESVTEGQVVARVAQPALFEELQEARARLASLRAEHERALGFAREDGRLDEAGLARERADLQASVAAAEASLRSLEERVRAQEELVRDGLMTRATLLNTQQQYDGTRERVRELRAALERLALRRLEEDNRRRDAVSGSEQRLQAARAEVAQLERAYQEASQVVSPYTGRVLEVMTEQGGMVGRGEPLLSLDLTGRAVKELVAVIYVPSVHGKKIRPGMPLHVAPSTVRQEEYGMMVGKVTYVSNFPATPRGMMRTLKNEQLVRELSGGGAPYEVHADLLVDPATASRYRWTSSGGPPMEVQSGTLAMGQVTVERERPIAAVLPLLRRWTGM